MKYRTSTAFARVDVVKMTALFGKASYSSGA